MFKSSSSTTFLLSPFPHATISNNRSAYLSTYLSLAQQITLASTMAIPDNVYIVTDTTGVIEVCTVKAMAEATAEKHSGSDVETHKLM